MVPQVGDFVAVGDHLFRIFRLAPHVPTALSRSVAIGQERTLEQDPTFAFRILVDIASKGLSPAINDPTTAVLAIDQIHHLLRNVGSRFLGDGRVRDSAGQLRLLYRTPNWDDFVYLAVTEIRHFGSESIQVARRLRAMLEDLLRTLPEERHVLLRQELDLLHRSAERFFSEPEDRELAGVSDRQGVGGKSDRINLPTDRIATAKVSRRRCNDRRTPDQHSGHDHTRRNDGGRRTRRGVRRSDQRRKKCPFRGQGAIANYVVVPAATVVLLLLFHAQPTVAAGFLILAVCPGAVWAALHDNCQGQSGGGGGTHGSAWPPRPRWWHPCC